MPIPQFQVDAFTKKPFAGNPAAVVLLGDHKREASWKQSVAAENNLAETAFITYHDDGVFGISWFTPTTEVDLCGHATLASAHALWEQGVADPQQPVIFRCAAHGELICERERHGMIVMSLPIDHAEPSDEMPEITAAIGVEPIELLRGREDYLFVVEHEDIVKSITPDFRALAEINARGVIVTAAGSGRHHVVSRCFFPRYGINEDPVTGSAHCLLGPYWIDRLDRAWLRCWQASKRGGEVAVYLEGDRVELAGRAVTTIRCELLV